MAALPQVLAGPIIRRIEPRLCSFWIALSHPASVQVSVWRRIQVAGDTPGTVASGEPELAGAIAVTLAAGRRLHVRVVTVKLDPAEPPFEPGQIHSYDIQVVTQSERKGLRQLGLLKNEVLTDHPELSVDRPLGLALGYVEDRLPSFVAAPPTIEQVRMAHCSCRKSFSPGRDALAWLDDVIEEHHADPAERPQQLFLTGDQIYADDFSAALLVMLGELAKDLMGARERLQVTTTTPNGQTIDQQFDADLHNFPAARRQKIVIELGGYTTEDGESHLLSFGEYAAMYLAVWSPRVWRTLGTPIQIFNNFDPDFPELQPFWSRPEDSKAFGGDAAKWRENAEKPESGFNRQVKQTLAFRDAVPHVARALANVATYMIFDDHDVTDDWNLNKKWVNRVYSKAFGRQIVRNAVMAYGVFQGWGNDPVVYQSGKNAEFLAEVARLHDGQGTPGEDPIPIGPTQRIDTLCGVTGADFKEQAVWNYIVRSPKTQVIVLDTRTSRKFTGQTYLPPDLIGLDREDQIPKGPLTDGRELLFIVSAAPVLGPDIIDALGWPLAQVAIDARYFGFGVDGTGTQKANVGVEKYDAEGWSSNEVAREELFKRVAPYERAVFLGGDVHFACSLTMDYYRKDVPLPSRFAQLTASPARNRFKPVVKLLLRQNAFLQTVGTGFSAERLAWNGASSIVLPPDVHVSPGRRSRIKRSPSLVPASGWPAGTFFGPGTPPDWRWRLQLVRDLRPECELPTALRQPVLAASDELVEPTPGDPDAALDAYRTVAARHQIAAADRFEFLRQMVFQTNLGLISLDKDAGNEMILRHTLLSQAAPGSFESAEGTVHVMSLSRSVEPPPEITFLDPPPPPPNP
jgi:hypothetical protein